MDHDYLLRSRVPDQKAQNPSRDLSGADGQADSLEAAGEEGSSSLPQGPERTASLPTVCHAASSLYAVVL